MIGRKIKHTKSGERKMTDERRTPRCERGTDRRNTTSKRGKEPDRHRRDSESQELERNGRTLKHKHKHQIVWWDRKKEGEKGVRVGFSPAVTKTTEENKLCKEEIPMFENLAR
jgi:hypothetical protein